MTRRAVLTFLAAVGVGAALTVTASSTVAQAHAHGLADLPAGALVVLLEVINVVGTWAWITDSRFNVRIESAVGVLGASGVTGTFGALTYGATGIVAAVGLLVAVHLVSRMWTVPTATRRATSGGGLEQVAETEPEQGNDLSPVRATDRRVEQLVQDLAAGRDVTGPQAAARFECSDRTARRLLADARSHLAQLPPAHDLHIVDPRPEEAAR